MTVMKTHAAVATDAIAPRDSVMDGTRFGLSRRPFRPHPDPTTYCPTDGHEAAAAALAGEAANGGIAILDGEPGTGKSLVVRRLFDGLPADTRRVAVHLPGTAGPSELLQGILFDLEQPYTGLREQELRLAVHAEVLTALSAGRPLALAVEDAHHLSPTVSDELRSIANLQSHGSKPVFVVLVGLPAVSQITAGDSTFCQRVGVRCRLTPLTGDETVRYVRHHLRECGGRPERLVTDEALAILADHCGGVPRLVNRVAWAAFELAEAAGQGVVDAEAVLEALARYAMLPPETEDAPAVLPIRPTPAASKRSKRKTA
jgi:type II secretory pathway predicted ATPase ExeA